jgi:hypothetical protein
MSDQIFPKGMFIKKNPKAPDFVIGKISIKVEDFIPFLQQNATDGWVNIEVKKKKADNSPYLVLDTWKPNQQATQQPQQDGFEQEYELPSDDITF